MVCKLSPVRDPGGQGLLLGNLLCWASEVRLELSISAVLGPEDSSWLQSGGGWLRLSHEGWKIKQSLGWSLA